MLKDALNTSAALKIYTVIVMAYVTTSVACDIVAFKMITIGNLFLMESGILFPSLYVFVDVITELFGGRSARFALLTHITCDFMFTHVILTIVHMKSPSWWTLQPHYNIVLDPMGRLYFANIVGALASAIINIYFLQRLKVLTRGKYFAIRSIISSGTGILIYTITTDLLAYSPGLSLEHLYTVTLFNIFTNIFLTIVYAIIAAQFVRVIKEFIITIDDQPTFNPFKV